jgi:tRNA threonylcarbamoyl adenosine modification protein YeaZ
MYYLLIDTSSSKGLVALLKNSTLLASALLPSLELSSSLMPTIQSLLHSKQLTPQSLEFIAVGNGPGSFTGTRIGVVVAKALSYGLSLPMISFSSLLAFWPKETPNTFNILLDAKSGQVYRLKILAGQKLLAERLRPTLEKIETLPEDEPYFSPDDQLKLKVSSLEKADFNLPFMIEFILNQYQMKRLIRAQDLQPVYLKTP